MRHDVIGIDLSKEDRIDHNSTIDEKLIRQFLVYIEYVFSILTMMNAHQGYKLSTTFNKSRLYVLLIRMIVKRKDVKRVDPLRSTELLNDKLDRGLSIHFVIEINKTVFHVKVFEPILRRPLFVEMISDTSGFVGTVTGGVHHHIRLS